MTKEDYVLIVGALTQVLYYHGTKDVDGVVFVPYNRIVGSLASVLASDNPRFNTTIFIDACNKPYTEQ